MPATHPLLVERQGCLTQATLILQRAKREGRDLTDDESSQCDGFVAKAEELQQRWSDQPEARRTRSPALGSIPLGGSAFRPPTSGLFGGDGGSVADNLFGRKTDAGGFASFGEWLAVMDSGRFDQRLQAANQVGIDSDGGFLVPEVYQNAFLDAVIESTILVKRVRKFPMTSDTLNLNGFDGNDHSSNLFGGLEAAWEGELSTLTGQSPKARRVSFHAKKLMILTQASNELVADAPSYESMLGSALVEATAWQLDYAILRGTGAGQPLGCLNADSAVEIAKESSQTATTIWFSNLLKMFARLQPASYKTAIWVINPSCIPELMTLDVHESATALGSALVGDHTYQPFRETDGRFSLFGRPVEVTEKLPTLGTVGDIILVDPQQYGLGMRQEVVVEKSAHAGFASDSSYYRAKMRLDGSPLWGKVMTPRAGDSLSWCITLATRE